MQPLAPVSGDSSSIRVLSSNSEIVSTISSSEESASTSSSSQGSSDVKKQKSRISSTSFETVSEFDDFYIVSKGEYDSDHWRRTVLANVTPDGYLRLVHVSNQDEQKHLFQANSENDKEGLKLFPFKEWVKIDMLIDF